MKITFVEDAWAEYMIWQRSDGKTAKKINDLLEDVCRHPFQGLGKPRSGGQSRYGSSVLPPFMHLAKALGLWYNVLQKHERSE